MSGKGLTTPIISYERKVGNRKWKTCTSIIHNKAAVFLCIACGECMHLTKKAQVIHRKHFRYKFNNFAQYGLVNLKEECVIRD